VRGSITTQEKAGSLGKGTQEKRSLRRREIRLVWCKLRAALSQKKERKRKTVGRRGGGLAICFHEKETVEASYLEGGDRRGGAKSEMVEQCELSLEEGALIGGGSSVALELVSGEGRGRGFAV